MEEQLERERGRSAALRAELTELRASFERLQEDAEELATRLLESLEAEKTVKAQLSALVESPLPSSRGGNDSEAQKQLRAGFEAELLSYAQQLKLALSERDAALERCAEVEAACGLAAARALSSFEEVEIRGGRNGDVVAQLAVLGGSSVASDEVMARLRRRNESRTTLFLDHPAEH